MKTNAIVLLAGLFLVLFALPAAAGDDEDWNRSGFYIGLSGVYTNNLFDDQVDDAVQDAFPAVGPIDVDIDDSFGLNARVGYRVASWVAFELQYEWIDEFEMKASATGVPDLKVDISGHSLTANAKLIAPIWRTQPYVLLGAGYALYDADVNSFYDPFLDGGKQSGFAGRLGGGVDWVITENILINTEATVLLTTQDFDDSAAGRLDDLFYVSLGVGLQYRF